MTYRIYSTCAAIFAFAFPIAALADNSTTLTTGQTLTVATGATGTSGGDLQFSSSGISMLGGAKNFALFGTNYSSAYPLFTITEAQLDATAMVTSPIPTSELAVGDMFLMETGGGVFAKFLVTASSSGSITLMWANLGTGGGGGNPGGGGGGNAPTITQVLDAGSYTANIAQGSIFVIKGTNMSPSGLTYGPSPLVTSVQNVSISFTPEAGGTATPAYIFSLYNENGKNQVAGLLPSTVPPGTYNVAVTNGTSTSSPVSVQVVASKPGLITQDSSGAGLAIVQNYNAASPTLYDLNRFTTGTINGTTISPSHPSQIEVAWLTGMDPLPSGIADNTAPNNGQGYDFTKHGVTVTANVGGMSIPAAYGGRTGCCAGEDEIVFTLPSNVPTSCVEPFYVTVNGVSSQTTFISVAPAGSNACVLQGYTTSQLQAIDNGGAIAAGTFAVEQEAASTPFGNLSFASVGGEFYSYSGFQLASAVGKANPFGGLPSGCTEYPIPGPQTTSGGTVTLPTLLDAGKLTVTGPSGSGLSNATLPDMSNAYSLSFSGEGATVNGNFVAGTYTLAGAGGKDVGPFNATMVIPTVLNVSNMPTVVNRSAGLQLNWSGGNSSDLVLVTVEATNAVNGVQTGGGIICFTTAGAGGINISSSLLNQLPAVASSALGNSTGEGGIDVLWEPIQSGSNGSFTASLTAGGSVTGLWTANSTNVADVPFQ